MNSNDFFHWIGEELGAAIRFLVNSLHWLFDHLYGAIDSFVHGLTSALGISASLLSIALLVIGLAFVYAALRALLRRAWIAGLVWAVLGLVLLSWLIH